MRAPWKTTLFALLVLAACFAGACAASDASSGASMGPPQRPLLSCTMPIMRTPRRFASSQIPTLMETTTWMQRYGSASGARADAAALHSTRCAAPAAARRRDAGACRRATGQ